MVDRFNPGVEGWKKIQENWRGRGWAKELLRKCLWFDCIVFQLCSGKSVVICFLFSTVKAISCLSVQKTPSVCVFINGWGPTVCPWATLRIVVMPVFVSMAHLLPKWRFQLFFMFIPSWGNDPIWRSYFSTGFEPPTTYPKNHFWISSHWCKLEIQKNLAKTRIKSLFLGGSNRWFLGYPDFRKLC